MEETKYTYIGKDIFYCMISLVLSTLIAYIFSILGFTDANYDIYFRCYNGCAADERILLGAVCKCAERAYI